MNITIRIARKTTGVAETLEAWVVDGESKGPNLLAGHKVSGVSTAQERISRKITKKYKAEVTITWELPPQ